MPEPGDEYLSCEWIEGGLAFNRRSLHACLIVHHRTGLPFICEYNGGPLPLAEIMRVRATIREANRSRAIHAECRGCAHLKRKRWPDRKHAFDILGIAQYSHCNIECNYCFLQTQDPASFESGYRPYPILGTIRQLLDEGLLAPDAIIDWGGGEPTIYREFDDILALTLASGARHYVHTNAVRFPELMERTAHSDRVHVICSVDAGLRETYRAMKKRDCLDVVWTNLSRYVAAGAHVALKYIVRTDNCSEEELDAFLSPAAAIGAEELILDIDYDCPDPAPEVIAALGKLKHRAVRAGLHARYGFTGDNFAAENGVGGRVLAAFQHEQLAALRRLLESRGYWVGDCVDQPIEALVHMLEGVRASTGKEIEALRSAAERRAQEVERPRAVLFLVRKLIARRIASLFAGRGKRWNTAG